MKKVLSILSSFVLVSSVGSVITACNTSNNTINNINENNNQIKKIISDNQNNSWVLTNNNLYYDKNNLSNHTNLDNLKKISFSDGNDVKIQNLKIDHQGNAWIIANNKFYFIEKNKTKGQLIKNCPTISLATYNYKFDDHSNVFLQVESSLYYISNSSLTANLLLSSSFINFSYNNKTDTWWISTRENLYYFTNKTQKLISQFKNNINTVRSVLATDAKGNEWFASYYDTAVLYKISLDYQITTFSNIEYEIGSINFDNNNGIWVISDQALYVMNNNSKSFIKLNLTFDFCHKIGFTKDKCWFSVSQITDNHSNDVFLYVISFKTLAVQKITEITELNDFIINNDSNLWIYTKKSGIYFCNSETLLITPVLKNIFLISYNFEGFVFPILAQLQGYTTDLVGNLLAEYNLTFNPNKLVNIPQTMQVIVDKDNMTSKLLTNYSLMLANQKQWKIDFATKKCTLFVLNEHNTAERSAVINLPKKNIISFLVDNQGNLWVQTIDNEIWFFQG